MAWHGRTLPHSLDMIPLQRHRHFPEEVILLERKHPGSSMKFFNRHEEKAVH
jgi:hypothetical protein